MSFGLSMESVCPPRAFPSRASAHRTKIPPFPALRFGGRRIPKSVKCGGRGGPAPEWERKLAEEVAGMGIVRKKCKEVKGGVAELLECLEREAIMGDDEGREPSDYNRRAQIFDKSSVIFQALKNGTIIDEDEDCCIPSRTE
ncbi:unnamed protein product [Cuscuta epithymum]|uniref:Uncharacterized protein n=1 Tax=Cuscuta epithymum TaxID=186058 RepID=A0AAV0EC81_9ASTE|nr:unnamed protein product [Cuscuta epithymum]